MSRKIYFVEPQDPNNHTHTIIFLHGRDSECEEFASEFFESEASTPAGQPRTLLDHLPNVRWVFPSAPFLSSARFGTTMSQWFDIWSVENPEEQTELQKEGLQMSVDSIIEIIRLEEHLVPRQNIFLGGISQGFATALAAFFSGGQNLAGLIGLCSWMPMSGVATSLIASKQGETTVFNALQDAYLGHVSVSRVDPAVIKSTPVFLGHAADDEIVPVQNGKQLRDILHDLNLTVDFHEYRDGGHWINEPDGVDDIVDFVTKICRNRSPRLN
ncbi:phospholipase/carboxylesterase [Annulohypoxylon maeteangense]|uniref:phospholipase/carboxylesterase n=1 Tax=Annulohypoxylon maeteangense TaxID=1927788 RepID=UPI0020074A15|nr:phospholipase/carboxylesterase [Annulohypoxylon maeteangense]KAI0882030.1 phospholipase/carboxylesterase [Annulohypoxylon maeteangense]